MKKFLSIAMVLIFAVASPVFAQPRDLKVPAAARAYEKASDRSALNRASDWFATRGKSQEERQMIIAERNAKRTAERMQKQAKKQEKNIKK